jgi:hypothetical protein
MTLLEEKKIARFKLLRALYDVSGGDRYKWPALSELGESAGLSHEQADQAAEYLSQEGLLEFKTFGPRLGITHRGVTEVEEALEHPDRATKYFLPVNIINVGVMIGSAIHTEGARSGDNISIGGNVTGSAVGSHASVKARDIVTQIQRSGLLGDDIGQAFARAAEELDKLKLAEGEKEDIADDLAKLKKELEKQTKDGDRIKTIWGRINGIASTVAAALSAAASIGKIVLASGS